MPDLGMLIFIFFFSTSAIAYMGVGIFINL